MRSDVASWFERRGSHVTEWPVERLVADKGATRVSVVLPALDEERTVGTIVRRIRRDLVERAAVVDELVVVDSGSSDATRLVAEDAGATVVRRGQVLDDVPPLPGKGEALWRSLAATTGDVVAFVDSDLRDFTSGFVRGLVGPLLADPTVHLVKATYDRALRSGETVLPAGGGRVTELVARPLLNLFWPQLAGFVQPLSGEYAARRTLLERLPFPTGYGVEVGLLVDALREVGLDGLAQVDLTRRKHRNSSDAALGRMATEIVRVVLVRLQAEGRALLPADLCDELVQFTRAGDGYHVTVTDLSPHERPPVVTLASYTAGAGRLVP
ncbi:MAG TPA: glucosyl-3-phosphoglycerate synthase [Jiangellales bacterium]|nr:glucosyl-3-phosphoglycerate synthase [Jiangellales bacterium]